MAKKIKVLRAERDLSQQELADDIGVSVASISNWEKDPHRMGAESIIKIALYFGVSADELLGIDKR